MDYIKKFENVGAFLSYLEQTPNSASFKEFASETGSRSFTGTESYQAADDLFKYGDTVSRDLIQAAVVNLRGTCAESPRRAFAPGVVGFAPNVPAFLRGLPENMIQATKKVVKDKVLNIIYNNNVNYRVDKQEIIDAGAKMLSAVLAVEKKGYRVNLYMNQGGFDGNETVSAFVKVKDSGTYIDRLKLAYPIVNPSFFRRHFFKYIEKQPVKGRQMISGYGYPLTRDRAERAAALAGIKGAKLFMAPELKNKSVQEIAAGMI